jgi:hypothetical protein
VSSLTGRVRASSPTTETGKIDYLCIWDTGATNSAVSKKVASDLKLIIFDYLTISTASGTIVGPIYKITLDLGGGIVQNVIASEAILDDFDILIGMDIIGNGDFTVSTDPKMGICLSYRIPSMGKIDYVVRAKNRKTNKSGNPANR